MKFYWPVGLAVLCCCLSTALFGESLEGPPPRSDQGLWQMLLMLGVFGLFFYVILWRPEQRRRRALDDKRNSLKKGDLVTAVGIRGKVSQLKEDTVILEMVDGSKIEFLKGAITDIGPLEKGKESSSA